MINEISLMVYIGAIIVYITLLNLTLKGKKVSEITLYTKIYEDWVENRKDENQLVTIQVIRNFSMNNSTLLSALLILLGILISLNTAAIFNQNTLLFFILPLGLAQVGLNIILISFCIVNFILSIRALTRLTLLISGNPEKYTIQEYNGLELTKKVFISAKNHWMYGIRGIFFLIPSLLWFVNSLLFLVSTVIILISLIFIKEIKLF
ncbi:MAG: DUF599 family protein [Promethearchaeota archaeon]|nr:MAG: DUF599 family protein [Candidatus Lokiarchaeota archaeon]